MTGAGFGGCAIALVHKNKISDFQQYVEKTYFEKTGLNAEFYESYAENGACRLL
jgi:galactokinase